VIVESYKNLTGRSGVISYEIGFYFIIIQSYTGAIYLYTNQNSGKDNIERLKLLARQGYDL